MKREPGDTDYTFDRWLADVQHCVNLYDGPKPDIYAAFWRECYDDGMTADQAYQEAMAVND